MAAFTGDILALLDKIPIWKRVQETPARVDELERRIAALEAKLAKPLQPACPKCGEAAYKLVSSVPSRGPFGDLGAKDVTRRCEACGHQETDLVTRGG